jgi:hypothetical protein
MKMHGKVIEGLTPEVIVIPKGENEIVFKAMPVLSYDDFEKLCPVPRPPEKIMKGGEKVLMFEDKDYNVLLNEWAEKKNAWTVITSLQATEGLEWETVIIGDPTTWENYLSELRKSFTDTEINLITNITYVACGLNQKKIDEATKRFLAGPVEVPEV